jgi:hypothetical protein
LQCWNSDTDSKAEAEEMAAKRLAARKKAQQAAMSRMQAQQSAFSAFGGMDSDSEGEEGEESDEGLDGLRANKGSDDDLVLPFDCKATVKHLFPAPDCVVCRECRPTESADYIAYG